MRDKCEWKDGKFYPCDNFDPENGNRHHDGYMVYCRGCGKSIDKPEPEVIIRKSGGTLVARINPVDFICLDPEEHEVLKNNLSEVETEEGIILAFPHIWKPISEIEITDEIAKLRPLVVWTYDRRVSNLCTLYAVNGMEFPCVCYNHESDEYDGYVKDECRLATVSDLEETK